MSYISHLKNALVAAIAAALLTSPAFALSVEVETSNDSNVDIEVDSGNDVDVEVEADETDADQSNDQAEQAEAYPTPSVSDHGVSPQYFDPYDGQSTTVTYCIDNDAQVKVGIYTVDGNDTQKVDILQDYTIQTTGCYSYQWDGENGQDSEVGTNGEIADYGNYFYGVSVKAPDSDERADYAADWIYITEDGEDTSLEIVDSDVDHRSFDPYDRQEAELNFTISKDAYVTVEIIDEDKDTVVELIENDYMTAGEHSVDWDGKDEYGDIVDQDEYQFKIRIEIDGSSDKAYENVRVEKGAGQYYETTEDPRLKNVYSTKDEFDPGRHEVTYIIFELTAEADLKVTIYDQEGEVLEELMDSENSAPGIYAVEWDGDLAIDDDGKYKYEVYAQNSAGEVTEDDYITVEEDTSPSNRPNVYKDHVGELPYQPGIQSMEIYFKLEDRDADEVTIEIKDGSKTIRTLYDEEYFSEGPHSVYWDGRDDYGELVDDGVYTYKIKAKNSKGSDTETGTFSVEGASYASNPGGQCAIFNDVAATSSYCEAIEWAYYNGVFEGYNDGTFKPNDSLTRAQAVKVILETLDVTLLPGGVDLGYKDTDPYEWYNRYIQTAMSLGIVKGYSDNYFRPNNSINRVEALKVLLETAKVKDGIIVPTNTYGQPYYDTPNNSSTQWYLSYVWYAKTFALNFNENYFYPTDTMTRAQMADMLYRYYLNQI